MAAPVAAAGISAGANLLGGGFDQAAQGKQHAAEGRQAAQLEPYLKQLTNFDTSGLRAHANDVMRTQGNALDATLAQRGIYNSGSALQQHQQLDSQVLGQLAAFVLVEVDQLLRQEVAAVDQAQAEGLEHPRQAEHVVAVEVGDEELLELDESDGAHELTLGPLATVDEQAIPAAPNERGGQAAVGARRRARRRAAPTRDA